MSASRRRSGKGAFRSQSCGQEDEVAHSCGSADSERSLWRRNINTGVRSDGTLSDGSTEETAGRAAKVYTASPPAIGSHA
eukprot:1928345-Pyramimonas_sp.AAC.1